MTAKKAPPVKAAAKRAPSKAVEKAPLRVASTRVDGPGTEVALREPMTLTYGTSINTVTITVTHTNPSFTGVITLMDNVSLPFTAGTATVTVDSSALAAIGALGFQVTIGAPGPAPAYDANLDTLVQPIVSNAASTTAAALKAAYGLKAGPNTWTGTQDFAGATVTGISGGSGGGPITSSEITDATTVGKAVLTATDAPTARTALGAGTSSFSGAYSDLSGKPSLAAVATSGAYADLTGRPTIPAGPTIVDNGTYVTMTVA